MANKFSTELFVKGRKSISICSAAKVTELLPTGSPKSSKRGAGARGEPKISGAAIILDRLIKDKNVAAIIKDEAVYCEISHPEGINAYFYDGGTRLYRKLVKDYRYEELAPFVIMALNHNLNDTYEETQAAFRTLLSEYTSTSAVTLTTLGYFCDCFYYASKDEIPDYTHEDLDRRKLNEIQQAIRTNSMQRANRACDVAVTFTHVDASSLLVERGSTDRTSDKIFLGKCMEEEFVLGYGWSEEQQQKIPSIDFLRDFIPNKEHKKLTTVAYRRLGLVAKRLLEGKTGKAAIDTDYINAILVGKPGTGKTATVEALAATLGMPLYTVPCSKNTEEDTFEGKTKVAEGGFRFFETSFLEAFEHGGIVCLEEFNLSDAGVMQGALGQALVPPFLLLKDSIKEVYRHPMCIVIMTMNTATQGSRMPNEAFTTRAPMTYIMDDPEEEQFIEILMKKGNTKRNSKLVYDTYMKIINHINTSAPGCDDLLLSLAIRHCIEALDLMKDFDFKDAIYDTMIGALAIKDMKLATTMYNTLIEPMPASA